MSRSWAGGSTWAWRKVRAHVLRRDQFRCQLKYDGCTTTATHVDHIQPREVAGDHPSNLRAACEHCNLRRGDPRREDPPPQTRRQW